MEITGRTAIKDTRARFNWILLVRSAVYKQKFSRHYIYTQSQTHIIDMYTCNATLAMAERRNTEKRNSDARAQQRR